MNSEKVKGLKEFIEMLESENELLRNAKVIYETVDYCAEDLNKAEKRIKELESENERLIKKNNHLLDRNRDLIRVCDTCKISIKQFAERLIEKKIRLGERFNIYDIDETLKEFINE